MKQYRYDDYDIIRNRTVSYGVMLFKDGCLMNFDTPHQNMMREVGWTDINIESKPDCDHKIFDPDLVIERPNCENCPRCSSKDPATGTFTDCCGNNRSRYDFYTIMNSNGSRKFYLAIGRNIFFGDEHLTVTFLNDRFCEFYVDKKLDEKLSLFVNDERSLWNNRKVIKGEAGGVPFKITNLIPSVDMLTMRYKDHNYTVIFGANINPNLKYWTDNLYRFYGRRLGHRLLTKVAACCYNIYPVMQKIMIDVDNDKVIGWYRSTVLYSLKETYNIDLTNMDNLDSVFSRTTYIGNIDDAAEIANYHYRYQKFKVVGLNELASIVKNWNWDHIDVEVKD